MLRFALIQQLPFGRARLIDGTYPRLRAMTGSHGETGPLLTESEVRWKSQDRIAMLKAAFTMPAVLLYDKGCL